MTESDHTPEPCEICGTTPKFVEREFPKLSSYHCLRCVACVRACAGIPTEQLQKGSVAALVSAVGSAFRNDGQYYPAVLHSVRWRENVAAAVALFQKD